jgi:hypothetical protein
VNIFAGQKLSFTAARIIALVTFVVAWLYCITQFGFLLGLVLGWLPATLLGLIAFEVGFHLWPVIVLAGLCFGLYLIELTR